MNQISLKEAELKAFRINYEDGLWDVLIGCFVLMFAVAPLLSETMGDFWSSTVFLPVWGLVYLAIWLTRKHVVAPRRGQVKFGTARKRKLLKFNLVMLVINTVALVLGIMAAFAFGKMSGGILSSVFGVILLVGFSAAAYYLDYPRLYLYGFLLLAAPIVGQYLYDNSGAAHHGFPITFGFTSGLMIVAGLVTFACFLQTNPVVETPAEGG